MLVLDPNNKSVSLPVTADGKLILDSAATVVPVPTPTALRVDAAGNLIVAP